MGKGRPDLTSLRQQIQVRKNEVKNSPLEEKKILRIEDLDLSIANITWMIPVTWNLCYAVSPTARNH